MHPLVLKQLQLLEKQYHELENKLSSETFLDHKEAQKLLSEFSKKQRFMDHFNHWKKISNELIYLKELLNDPNEDAEMHALCSQEYARFEKEINVVEKTLNEILLPEDPLQDQSCFLEIRAGTGGEEAAVFCADLFRMYSQYALSKKYIVEIHHRSESEVGGLKSITIKISGRGAYGQFQHESGGHRVQRVPETESQGRVHTSNCIVMVIPDAPQRKEIEINPSDLRVDTYRASGAGGQHVNKTDSAVRITHLPTGIVATCQMGRNQHQNRSAAMDMLLARLTAFEEEKHQKKETELRLSLLSSGKRSDRIRTYNFPQGRITDHRLPITLFNLESILSGNLELILEPILQEYQVQRIAQMQESFLVKE